MGYENFDKLPLIESPMEIFELRDREYKDLIITNWKEGRSTIKPDWQPEGKEVKVLRVWVPQSIKPMFPNYYDITAQGLIAQMLPFLQRSDFMKMKFRITKYGEPPKARFQLQVKNETETF